MYKANIFRKLNIRTKAIYKFKFFNYQEIWIMTGFKDQVIVILESKDFRPKN